VFASFVLVSLGYVPLARADLNDAAAMFTEALATSRKFGYRRNEARALHGLAEIADVRGKMDQAEESIRASEAIYRDVGDTAALVTLLNARGALLLRQGNVRQAREVFTEASVLARTRREEVPEPAQRAAEALASTDDPGRESLVD
jgi:tetratricopeptide (TPR) repeat protein